MKKTSDYSQEVQDRRIDCPYCKGKLRLKDFKLPNWQKAYPTFVCETKGCDSRVGIHKSDGRPLGTPANDKLRKLRKNAHTLLDSLWKWHELSGKMRHKIRQSAYQWLSQQMSMKIEDCHIGEFREEDCHKAIRALLRERKKRREDARMQRF